MNYKVSVDKIFSAAHALREYRGKCERLHGHNWKVRLTVSGSRLNKIGMVADFSEMKNCLEGILGDLDHRCLNETAAFKTINPTAENIASCILRKAVKILKLPKGIKVSKVSVWESENSFAEASL
jgi:6-pyruvoyltetrahydropterin/6-carboxytetrahydropterin synthase